VNFIRFSLLVSVSYLCEFLLPTDSVKANLKAVSAYKQRLFLSANEPKPIAFKPLIVTGLLVILAVT
jgi:hypothetical protein